MFPEQPADSSSQDDSFHSLSPDPSNRDTHAIDDPPISPLDPSLSPSSSPLLSSQSLLEEQAQDNPSSIPQQPLPLDPRPYNLHNVGIGLPKPGPLSGRLSPFHRDPLTLFQHPPIQPSSSSSSASTHEVSSSVSKSSSFPTTPPPSSPLISPTATPSDLTPQLEPSLDSDIPSHPDTSVPSLLAVPQEPTDELAPVMSASPASPPLTISPPSPRSSVFGSPSVRPLGVASIAFGRPSDRSSSPRPQFVREGGSQETLTTVGYRSPQSSYLNLFASSSTSSPTFNANCALPSVLPSTSPSPLSFDPNEPLTSTPALASPPNSEAGGAASPTATQSQMELAAELEFNNPTTLEKIYLFCKSPVVLYRVFIVRELARYLRSGIKRRLEPEGEVSPAAEQSVEDEEVFVDDFISPAEAVEYVLPLLGGLATDEDESVKEALATELVSIVWWFVTNCKVVEDSALPVRSEDYTLAEDYVSHIEPDVDPEPGHGSDVEQFADDGSVLGGMLESHTRSAGVLGLTIHELGSGDENSDTRIGFGGSNLTPATSTDAIIYTGDVDATTTTEIETDADAQMDLNLGDQQVHDQVTPESVTLISVQSFTPILGTLLLSTNPHVGVPARFAVVELLKRIRKVGGCYGTGDSILAEPAAVSEPGPTTSDESASIGRATGGGEDEEENEEHEGYDGYHEDEGVRRGRGFFGEEERKLFERELVQQVVIGMGRLDIMDESTEGSVVDLVGSDDSDEDEHEHEQIEHDEGERLDGGFLDLPTPLARPPIVDAGEEETTPSVERRYGQEDSYFPPVPFSPSIAADAAHEGGQVEETSTEELELGLLGSSSDGSTPTNAILISSPTPSPPQLEAVTGGQDDGQLQDGTGVEGSMVPSSSSFTPRGFSPSPSPTLSRSPSLSPSPSPLSPPSPASSAITTSTSVSASSEYDGEGEGGIEIEIEMTSLSAPSTPSLDSSSSSSGVSPASGEDVSPPVDDLLHLRHGHLHPHGLGQIKGLAEGAVHGQEHGVDLGAIRLELPRPLVQDRYREETRIPETQVHRSQEQSRTEPEAEGQTLIQSQWDIHIPTPAFEDSTGAGNVSPPPGSLVLGSGGGGGSSSSGSDDGVGGWHNQRSEWDESDDESEDEDPVVSLSEEAAVGRLSSMSLMAAVTASGFLSDDTKLAFVREVERVGRDPEFHWVRREASFALGALAKVVPAEVVKVSLVPLFQLLCQDPAWNVRQSALFALPAILSRLSPSERRKIALEVIIPFSKDVSPKVRTGVLEALAEVMYAFKGDEGGPPDELLRLFLGIREGETTRRKTDNTSGAPFTWDDLVRYTRTHSMGESAMPEEDIYDDPARPLICAFNYPAVAVTLGRERWGELSELYRDLAANQGVKVKRTLAASLGEIAKIVGPENAKRDLVDVWWGSVRCDFAEVRDKAVECLEVFLRAIGLEERGVVVKGIVEEVWRGRLKGWREREGVMKCLGAVVQMEGIENESLRRLVVMGLEDPVAAVREAAVAAIPSFLNTWSTHTESLHALLRDIEALGSSGSYRKRMTYVACQQGILQHGQMDAVIGSNSFWETLKKLVQDPIIDVRIRTARLLGLISEQLAASPGPSQSLISELAQKLVQDPSHEVVAFAERITTGPHVTAVTENPLPPRILRSSSNFSRPPPAAPG